MPLWRPPIALTFTRDTAYPIHAQKFCVGWFARLPEALHFISWLIVHRSKLHVYYPESEVYFVGDYTSLGDKEAIDWLSQKIGRSFIDYAADLFVELCEKRKTVCDTEHWHQRQVMFFTDKKVYLYGIDFENQIIKIARSKAGGLGDVISYPAEEALEMLGIDWDVVRRTFGVAYLTVYKKQELINALNKLIKDEVIIKVWMNVMQKPSGTIYHTRVIAASPNNMAFQVKLNINPHLKTMMLPCQIVSHKGGVTISNLDDPNYKMLHIPAEQKVIFQLIERNRYKGTFFRKLPLELKLRQKDLPLMWDTNSWLLLASWDTFRGSKDGFEVMKVSSQAISEQDFGKLIDTLELRSIGNKHI